MTQRSDVLEAVLAGRARVDEAALVLGEPGARVAEAVAVLRRLRRERRRRRALVAGTLAGLAVLVVGARVSAQASCAQTLPAPLVTFCQDTPAQADTVNANFQALANAITGRLGPLDGGAGAISGASVSVSGAATVGGALSAGSLSAGGAVSAASVSTTGAATVGGNATIGGGLTVTGPLQAGCPTAFPIGGGAVNMVDLGASCIMYEGNSDLARNAKSWLSANEYCVGRGLRLCHPSEVSAAARLSKIRTYLWSEGDYWAWVDQTASDSNAAGFGGCHVNLNSNQPGFALGDINCAIDAYNINPSIEGLCCL